MGRSKLLTCSANVKCLTVTLFIGILVGYGLSFIKLKIGSGESVENVAHSRLPRRADSKRYEEMYKRIRTDSEYYEDSSVADRLAQKVRVVCWVLTCPENHRSKADHVKATWGKRCNKLLFMSTTADKKLPTVNLSVPEGRDYLWHKTVKAFRYIYQEHREEGDWFLKADDDTYVVVENLRYMLADYNSSELLYFGCRFKSITTFIKQGYMSGGAGYVISRAALDKLVDVGMRTNRNCGIFSYGNSEDVEIGICLNSIGVRALSSLDRYARNRFHPFRLGHHLVDDNFPDWYVNASWFSNPRAGYQTVSRYLVSFHYARPYDMYKYDFLLYYARVFGRDSKPPLPRILRNQTNGSPYQSLDQMAFRRGLRL